MKKILMINYEFPPIGGGTANANYYFLKELSKIKDISVDLVTSTCGNRNLIEKFSDNINIHKIGIKKKDLHHWSFTEILSWCVKAFFYLKKLIEKGSFDINHCWCGWPSGYFGYLFRNKIPYIVALRGHDVPGYEVRYEKIEKLFIRDLSRKIWRNAKKLTANSSELAALSQNTLKTNIEIIYNGIDTDEFKPIPRNECEKIILISTGRLGQRKGHIYLLKALRKYEEFKLIIVGQGAEFETLKKESEGLDVEFRGYIEHKKLPAILNEADAYISTSLVEGMSNSIMEAMACGLPIISTNVGGAKELINGNGYVIDKTADVESIEKAFDFYKNNKAFLASQGRKSREIAERFSWANVAKQYIEKIYN